MRVASPTVRVAPVTTTRTYGPAGRPSAAAEVVLTATDTAPDRLNPVVPPASMTADSVPATPPFVASRLPATDDSDRYVEAPAPTVSVPPLIDSRVLPAVRSTVTVPDRDCPATPSVRLPLAVR